MRYSAYLLATVINILFIASTALAQGISYSTTGVASDPSAILDMGSTTKGLLVPRMTSAQKTAIALPATGLLVFQTDGTTGFYYYDGSAWVGIAGSGGSVTAGNGLRIGGTGNVELGGTLSANDTIDVGSHNLLFNNGGSNITIGNHGSADSSAILSVSSDSKGMLVPRMDSAHRAAIASPATGLLVYQTDGVMPGFCYYNGAVWTMIGRDGPAPGIMRGDMLYWDSSAWVPVPAGMNGQVLSVADGIPVWVGIAPNTTNLPVITGPVTGITTTGAAGTITIGNDGSYGRSFDVGVLLTQTDPAVYPMDVYSAPSTTLAYYVPGSTVLPFTTPWSSATFGGLLTNTKYYVRGFCVDSASNYTYGNIVSFTTNPGATIPTLVGGTATVTTPTNVHVRSTITANGGSPITVSGVCWGTSHMPTTALPFTTTGGGLYVGSPVADVIVTTLAPATTYYARYYATNAIGTGYGPEVSFVLPTLPAVTTGAISVIGAYTATGGGTVTSTGGGSVTAGVCWSTSPAPIIAGITWTATYGITTVGSYPSSMTGLIPGTTYYVRAYASTTAGTVYGSDVSFTTVAAPSVITTPISSGVFTSTTGGGTVISAIPILYRGVCWSTSPAPTMYLSTATIDGSGPGSFTSSITGLTLGTTYYVRAYAVHATGVIYGADVVFATFLVFPTVITDAATSIGNDTAISGGNVTSIGGGPVTARGVCWSTGSSPTVALATKTIDGAGPGAFTSRITGLLPAVNYNVRAYATNGAGTAYGPAVNFTTTYLPYVNLLSVTGVSSSGATGSSIITNAGFGSIMGRGVQWGTVACGCYSDSTTDGTGIGSFTSNITGLTPGVAYNVRAYARNVSARTFTAPQVITTTLSMTPIVNLNSPFGSYGSTTATTGGDVTSSGGSPVTARGVQWGTTFHVAIGSTTDGTGPGTYTSLVTGLTPGTNYFVWAYATNSFGTVYSPAYNFTTTTHGPIVTTSGFSAITGTTATGGGNVTSAGTGGPVTARGVCWSATAVPNISDPHTVDGSGTGVFTSSITGLAPATWYTVRAYATSSMGTGYGPDSSFSTFGLAVVSDSFPRNITSTSAICAGLVSGTWGSSVTARGICWGTSSGPGLSGSHTVNGSGSGSFTGSLSGLTPYTVYYVRAYATTPAGTVFGTEYAILSISGGDSYGGGFFLKLFTPGDPGFNAAVPHGLILGPSDISTSAPWYNGSYISVGTTSTAFGAGLSNTLAIIAAQGSSGSYAANLCRASSLGGYSDWYLPSQWEFLTLNSIPVGIRASFGMYTTVNPSGGFLAYWWSTQASLTDAGSSGGSADKATLLVVRAFRTF